MGRPQDWSALGMHSDPTPGDPDALQTLLDGLRHAESLGTSMTGGLNRLLDTSDEGFVGKTAEAVREKIDKHLKQFIDSVGQSFGHAASATADYLNAVREAQAKTDHALQAAQGLSKDDVQLVALKSQAHAGQDEYRNAVAVYHNKLDEAGDMIRQPIDKWHLFLESLGILEIILAIVGAIFGGWIGLLAFGLGMVMFVSTLVDYAQGKAGALDVLLAFIGILFPSTKGLPVGAIAKGVLNGLKDLPKSLSSGLVSAGGALTHLFTGGLSFRAVFNVVTALPGAILHGLGAAAGLAMKGVKLVGAGLKLLGTAFRTDFHVATAGINGTFGKVGFYTFSFGGRFLLSATLPVDFFELGMGFGAAFKMGFGTRLFVPTAHLPEAAVGGGLHLGSVTGGDFGFTGLTGGVPDFGGLGPGGLQGLTSGGVHGFDTVSPQLGGLHGLGAGTGAGTGLGGINGLGSLHSLDLGAQPGSVDTLMANVGGLTATDHLTSFDQATGFQRNSVGLLEPLPTHLGGIHLGGASATGAAHGGMDLGTSGLHTLRTDLAMPGTGLHAALSDGMSAIRVASGHVEDFHSLGIAELKSIADGDISAIQMTQDGVRMQIGGQGGTPTTLHVNYRGATVTDAEGKQVVVAPEVYEALGDVDHLAAVSGSAHGLQTPPAATTTPVTPDGKAGTAVPSSTTEVKAGPVGTSSVTGEVKSGSVATSSVAGDVKAGTSGGQSTGGGKTVTRGLDDLSGGSRGLDTMQRPVTVRGDQPGKSAREDLDQLGRPEGTGDTAGDTAGVAAKPHVETGGAAHPTTVGHLLDDTSGAVAFGEHVALRPTPTPTPHPQTVGGNPPVSRFEAVTGGVGGKTGQQRLTAWNEYERANVDLAAAKNELHAAGGEIDRPSETVDQAAAKLNLHQAGLSVDVAKSTMSRFGMDADVIGGHLDRLGIPRPRPGRSAETPAGHGTGATVKPGEDTGPTQGTGTSSPDLTTQGTKEHSAVPQESGHGPAPDPHGLPAVGKAGETVGEELPVLKTLGVDLGSHPSWKAIRDGAVPRPVTNRAWPDPVSHPGRAKPFSGPIRDNAKAPRYVVNAGFDVRRFEVDGHAVSDLTVRVHLSDTGVSPAGADALWDRAVTGVGDLYNRPGYVLGDGSVLHVTLQRVDSPKAAHVEVTAGAAGAGANQKLWPLDASETDLAHEIGHQLGLRDEYRAADAGHRPNQKGSLMGDYTKDLTGGGMRPHYLTLIQKHLDDLAAADHALVVYGFPGPQAHDVVRVHAPAPNAPGVHGQVTEFKRPQRFSPEFSSHAKYYDLKPVAQYDGAVKGSLQPGEETRFIATVPATVAEKDDLLQLAKKYKEAFGDDSGRGERLGLVIGLNGRPGDEGAILKKINDFAKKWDEQGTYSVSVTGFTWRQPDPKLRAAGTQKEIPYGAIREAIVRDDLTKDMITKVADSEGPVYLHLGDVDVKDMKVGGRPLLDEAARVIDDMKVTQVSKSGETVLFPEVVSGGYKLTDSAAATKAADLDLAVRDAMGGFDSRAVYFPEPNTFVRLDIDTWNGLEEQVHFGVKQDGKWLFEAQEGKHLLKNVVDMRKDAWGEKDVTRMVRFTSDLALVTDGGRIAGELKGDLKSLLGGLTQSHADKKVWRDQITDYLDTHHHALLSKEPNAARLLTDMAFHDIHTDGSPLVKMEIKDLAAAHKEKLRGLYVAAKGVKAPFNDLISMANATRNVLVDGINKFNKVADHAVAPAAPTAAEKGLKAALKAEKAALKAEKAAQQAGPPPAEVKFKRVLVQPGYATGDQFGIVAALRGDPDMRVVLTRPPQRDNSDSIRDFYVNSGISKDRIEVRSGGFSKSDQVRYWRDLNAEELKASSVVVSNGEINRSMVLSVSGGTEWVAKHFSTGMRDTLRDVWRLNDAHFSSEAKQLVGSWLTEQKVPDPTGRHVVVLWSRFSGKRGEAHIEHDTSHTGVKQILNALHENTADPSRKPLVIITGDGTRPTGPSHYPAIVKEFEDVGVDVHDLTDFWKRDGVGEWSESSRIGQLRLFEYLHQVSDGGIRHLGFRSGNLEALALAGHEVRYLEEPGSKGGDRMAKWHQAGTTGRTALNGLAPGYERILIERPPTRTGQLFLLEQKALGGKMDRPAWTFNNKNPMEASPTAKIPYSKGFAEADVQKIVDYLLVPHPSPESGTVLQGPPPHTPTRGGTLAETHVDGAESAGPLVTHTSPGEPPLVGERPAAETHVTVEEGTVVVGTPTGAGAIPPRAPAPDAARPAPDAAFDTVRQQHPEPLVRTERWTMWGRDGETPQTSTYAIENSALGLRGVFEPPAADGSLGTWNWHLPGEPEPVAATPLRLPITSEPPHTTAPHPTATSPSGAPHTDATPPCGAPHTTEPTPSRTVAEAVRHIGAALRAVRWSGGLHRRDDEDELYVFGPAGPVRPAPVFADGLRSPGQELIHVAAHVSEPDAPGSAWLTATRNIGWLRERATAEDGAAAGLLDRYGWRYDISAPGGVDLNATLDLAVPHPERAEVLFPGGVDSRYVRGAQRLQGGRPVGPYLTNPGFVEPGVRPTPTEGTAG